MGRPKGATHIDFESIVLYLTTGNYPESLKNDGGKKTNFKRQASNYAVHDGRLYFKHRPHRQTDEGTYQYGQFCVFLIFISCFW